MCTVLMKGYILMEQSLKVLKALVLYYTNRSEQNIIPFHFFLERPEHLKENRPIPFKANTSPCAYMEYRDRWTCT